MPDTILEGNHPRIISAKFGWDWLSSFRAEDYIYIYIYIIDIYISSWSAIICGDQFTYRHFNIFIFTYQFQIYIQFLIHQFQYKLNFKYIHCNIVESFCQILPNLLMSYLFFRASRIIWPCTLKRRILVRVEKKRFSMSKKTYFWLRRKA